VQARREQREYAEENTCNKKKRADSGARRY
jgi:hypothetical protein